ncbi:phage tail assembly chaperone [Marinibaculum pumilum]|uniref:Phage tail assembly chaperone n=1 Tax=Marinibaculum pumilum TaxID=1766165 RepID=A0ABV7KYE4_9PROT
MIEHREKTIGGHEYSVTQFPAMQGLRIAVRLVKLVGPGMAKALDGKGLAGVLDSDIGVSDMVGALVDRLDEGTTPEFVRQLLSATVRDGRDLSDERNFNDAYAANYRELIGALGFVLEVNYGDFFGAVTAGIGAAGGRPEGTPTYRES